METINGWLVIQVVIVHEKDLQKALEMGKKSLKEIHEVQKKALKEKYQGEVK